MMFLRTIAAVFSGVSAFPELMRRNPFRALFHLFLFCAILALGTGVVKSVLIGRDIDRYADAFARAFGAIDISEKGILPEKDPGQSRVFYLAGNTRLDYVTRDSLPNLSDMNSWRQSAGVIWAPRGFLLWARPEGTDVYLLTHLPCPDPENAFRYVPGDFVSYRKYTAPELLDYVKSAYFAPMPEETDGKTVSFAETASIAKGVVFVFAGLSMFFAYFLLALITILMFAGMQQLWKTPGFEKVGFGATFTVMVYSAFPALLCSAAFAAFSLPFVSFETVFFIVFFLYHLLAFNAIRRSFSPPRPDDGDDDGNDN